MIVTGSLSDWLDRRRISVRSTLTESDRQSIADRSSLDRRAIDVPPLFDQCMIDARCPINVRLTLERCSIAAGLRLERGPVELIVV